MTDNSTSPTSFRTAADTTRMQRAAEVVARHTAAVERARAALLASEDACAMDPTDKAFTKAKAARAALEDVERDLALATAHANKVEAEIAAAERARIAAEVARLESSLTEIVDDDAREAAVEIAYASSRLRERMLARLARRRGELEAMNRLRARIGAAAAEVPTDGPLITLSVNELAEIGLAAQALSGASSSEIRGTFASLMPFWRVAGSCGPKEYLQGHNYSSPGINSATQEDEGLLHADHVREVAARLLSRVQSRSAALDKDKGIVAGIAVQAAAVGALAVLVATNVMGG